MFAPRAAASAPGAIMTCLHQEHPLTVLAGATRDVPVQISCWLKWMSDMTAADNLCEYELHMVLRPPTTNVTKRRIHWYKLDYIEETLRRLPDGAHLIYSDLDVLPIRPYSKLLESKDASGHSVLGRDAVFMRVPNASKASKRCSVNAGFFLMRASPAVRTLIVAWRAALREGEGDQLALNRVLQNNASSSHSTVHSEYRAVDWHVFERRTIAGLEKEVLPGTVAYHAVMAMPGASKNQKLLRVWNRTRAFSAHGAMVRWCT